MNPLLNRKTISLLCLLLLAGCAPAAQPTLTALPPTATASPSAAPTVTVTPQPPTATPVPLVSICSPLKDIALADMSQIISNPFEMPRPGEDDKHHGVDLAFYQFQGINGVLGHAVQSVFPGKVVAVIANRPPYGNALIIETHLENIPTAWQSALLVPAPQPTVVPPQLSCPTGQPAPSADTTHRSLYLLYAHLKDAPLVKPGDTVTCGQQIGLVGTTGFSVNPHLHLEVRAGPAGATFAGMAHYIADISDEERANYCAWRVSGWFQLIDPTLLFGLK